MSTEPQPNTNGIHRTFLAHDGKGTAPVKYAGMRLGACSGGVVHIGEPGETLMLGV